MGKKTPKLPLPLGISSPRQGGLSHGDRQHAEKMVKIARVVREVINNNYTRKQTGTHTHTHTHTHTDVLITILRHRSPGRSENGIPTCRLQSGLIS